MTPREPKAAEWLRQQIDELGALRNASVRDPQFKAWRQNTLTFIQRIWPGDTSKSERFRRVPFTPPSTRHDARTGREYYERGCGEALEYLSSLLAQLGNEPAAEAIEAERHPESFEGDFPEIDLGGSPARPVGAAPPAAFDERPATPAPTAESSSPARGQGPPELPASAGRPTSPGSSGDFLASAAFLDPEAVAPGNLPVEGRTRFGTPSPPRLPEPPARPNEGASRISVRGNTPPSEPRGNPLENFLQRSESEESARQDAARHDDARKDAAPAPKNGKHKKGKSPKQRLKDMLGLSSLEQEAHPSPEAPPAIPREASKIEVRRERFQAPPPPAPTEPPAAAPGADDSPAFHRGVERSGGWSLPEFLTPDETMPLPAPAPPASHAPPAAPEAARPEEMRPPEPREEDAGDTARVTAEFLSKSPVLSSLPRPVNRRAPEGADLGLPARGPHGPAASQILAIAAEVDSLGVPEGHRARARATLLDLSRQLDDGGIAWDVLRDAIHFVMEFPPLARRVLPLLLPFLDLAA